MQLIRISDFKPQFLLCCMLGWPVLLLAPAFITGSLERPVTHPGLLAYYGALFGAFSMLPILAMISMRWRQIILKDDASIRDVLPSLIAISLVFGMLSVGNFYSLLDPGMPGR